MDNNVIVSIIGNQVVESGKEDLLEMITEGSFYRDHDSLVLQYEESELSGMDGTTTKIVMDKNSMSLQREGTFNAYLVFEKFKTYQGQYSTPYGDVSLELLATDFGMNVDESMLNGKIDIEYEMDIMGNRSCNQLIVSFRSKKNNT